jgi:hypothetical protein
MEITRIPIERIKPQPAKKSSRQIKTHGENTPRAESFKNPLLGIEVNLLKQIQAVNSKHFETSFFKRNVLLDALDDIASTGLGFEDQLQEVVTKWRPPTATAPSAPESYPLSDLIRAHRVCREAIDEQALKHKRNQQIREEISKTEAITMHFYSDVEAMKKRLSQESDHFALPRKLNRALAELETDFVAMFSAVRIAKAKDELAELEAANATLRGQLYRQRYELEICEHISSRLRLTDGP